MKSKDGSSLQRLSLIDKFNGDDFFDGQPNLRVRFTEVVRKFNLELMKSTCQVMKGCKQWKAKQIADSVFELLNEILNHSYQKVYPGSAATLQSAKGTAIAASSALAEESNLLNNKAASRKDSTKEESEQDKASGKSQLANSRNEGSSSKDEIASAVFVVKQVTTSVSTLKDILNFCFKMNNYTKPDCLKDFLVASLLMQSKINVIVLLAGTSGTGKSTLASLLGTRLGISTVLSTDSVRHVMRNFL